MPATTVTAETLSAWLRGCAAAIAEQRDYLTQLDAAIGDADHGANMTRGFDAVQVKLDDLDGATPPGKLLIAAGSTLVSTVGGASGPLWGSGLRKAGRSLGDAERIDPAARSGRSRRRSPASSSSGRPSAGTRRWSMRSLPPSTASAAR